MPQVHKGVARALGRLDDEAKAATRLLANELQYEDEYDDSFDDLVQTGACGRVEQGKGEREVVVVELVRRPDADRCVHGMRKGRGRCEGSPGAGGWAQGEEDHVWRSCRDLSTHPAPLHALLRSVPAPP